MLGVFSALVGEGDRQAAPAVGALVGGERAVHAFDLARFVHRYKDADLCLRRLRPAFAFDRHAQCVRVAGEGEVPAALLAVAPRLASYHLRGG